MSIQIHEAFTPCVPYIQYNKSWCCIFDWTIYCIARIYVTTYSLVHNHLNVSTYTNMYACTQKHIHTYTHTHPRTHAHTHTHTHIHMYISYYLQLWPRGLFSSSSFSPQPLNETGNFTRALFITSSSESKFFGWRILMAVGDTHLADPLDTVHHEINSMDCSHHVYKSV